MKQRTPTPPSCCAWCGGALGENPATYHRWTVCATCLGKLQPAQAQAETPRRPRRRRCAFCYNLQERNELHPFTSGDPQLRAHQVYAGRLLCQKCTIFLTTRCAQCGRHGAIYNAADFRTLLCEVCSTAHWNEVNRRIRQRSQADALLNPAAQLAQAAGVPLPDPLDVEAVRRLWKLAARRAHPDAGGDHNAFIAAQRCYEAALSSLGVQR